MEECVFGAAVSETGRIGPEAAAYIKKEPCMLNEDKIKLMTELALFEKKHASQMKTVNQYFKSDYISRNLLRGFISYTLCSILLFGMWVLFNVEVVLSSIGMDELKGLAFRGGALYLGILQRTLAIPDLILDNRVNRPISLFQRMNLIILVISGQKPVIDTPDKRDCNRHQPGKYDCKFPSDRTFHSLTSNL